jgi:sensor c-di-GMP phosphodiesterase-like protein
MDEVSLEIALQEKQIVPYFQPLVDLKAHLLLGF